MNHIGNVIKEVRCNIGMSRNELSEKYLLGKISLFNRKRANEHLLLK